MTPTAAPIAPTPPRRTRTDPTLKWLLAERATISGAHQAATEAVPRLQRRVARAQLLLERAQHQLAVALKSIESNAEKLQAFDCTIGQLSPEVNPEAGGVVKAWKGKYGERGALTQFLYDALKSKPSQPVSLAQLLNEVELHFGVLHLEPSARKKLRYSIRTCLRQLQTKTGQVEPVRDASGQTTGKWIFRGQPSLADLRALAALQPAPTGAGYDGPRSNSDLARGEVGGQ